MKLRWCALVLVLLLVSVAAFGQRHGGTLIISDETPVNTLDPHLDVFTPSRRAITQMFECLVMMDETLTVQPHLATSWALSDDGLILTFELRQDVLFHHGKEMTSDDVVFSLNRARSPEGADSANISVIDRVEATGRYGVQLTLSEPFAPLLSFLTRAGCAIVPRDVVEQEGDLVANPVGTGPFRLASMDEDGYLVLERNGSYWDAPLPYLDQIIFRPILETDERIGAFLDGDADIILGIPMASVDQLDALEGVSLNTPNGDTVSWLGMNRTAPPFDDLRVRQAVALAIDREAILNIVHDGRGVTLLCGPYSDIFWYGLSETCIQASGHVERAKELLAAAGYPDGFTTSLLMPEGYERMNAEFRVAAGFLAEIGIEVELVFEPIGEVGRRLAERETELYAMAWGSIVDPHRVFYGVYHSDGYYNYSGISDPQINAMLEEASSEPDQAVRASLYQAVSRRLVEDAASAFHVQTAWYGAHRSSRVKDFTLSPIGGFEVLRSVWISE